MSEQPLYSQRRKPIVIEEPSYEVTSKFRNQFIDIACDVLGHAFEKAASGITKHLCHEYGMQELASISVNRFSNEFPESIRRRELLTFFYDLASADEALDVVELFIPHFNSVYNIDMSKVEEIVNKRFKQWNMAYRLENGVVIRADSEFMHDQVVKESILLLRDPMFVGANEEYMRAHEFMRHGNYKDAMTNALKAFESTMKTICELRGWSYQPVDTAGPLIKICIDNGLIPPFWQSQYESLKTLLTNGVPTGRNKLAGHGQGSQIISPSDSTANFVMHVTAANIVFLVSAYKALP